MAGTATLASLRAAIAAARANPAPLSDWEARFLRDLDGRHHPPTQKQVAILARIAARVDFATVNRAAGQRAEEVCRRLLPGGARRGTDGVAGDLSGAAGQSLRMRVEGERAGCWIDNATGDKGGDFVSLAAAVARLPQADAARHLAHMLGLGAGEAAQ